MTSPIKNCQQLITKTATTPKPKIIVSNRSPQSCKRLVDLLNKQASVRHVIDQYHLISGALTEPEYLGEVISNLNQTIHLLINKSDHHHFVLPQSLSTLTIPSPKLYRQSIHHLQVGESIRLPNLTKHLTQHGYTRYHQTIANAGFHIRGEQVDIKHPAHNGYYTITLHRSSIESIIHHTGHRHPRVNKIALPPVTFPQQKVSLDKTITDMAVFPITFSIPKPLPQPITYQHGLNLIANLQVGKPAVHTDHGIGIYDGLQTRTINKQIREYLLLRYAEGDTLSVPVEYAFKVTAYLGEASPTIYRLSNTTWQKTHRAAQEDAVAFARDLIKTANHRDTTSGHAYQLDPILEQALTNSFPYQLTPDQSKAWQEVKTSLSSDQPTDRLVVGDVGFGKTELAIRAAFHAANNNQQVAILAPTTLLVQQHTDTFLQRLRALKTTTPNNHYNNNSTPVIGVLSRFSTLKEQADLRKRIAAGQIDIVIGTHALLSKKTRWHNLGLVIIDEEQRFGVKQKEHFKNLRSSIDILSLSATPIPRTLSMSLSGLKQLSIISTPPAGRKSVSTIVAKDNDAIIKQAITCELNRQGQTYIVAPRIRQLNAIAHRLTQIVPQASHAIIHGQLSSQQLASTMQQFDNHQLDVLISSTIIENGLDLPQANTIIILNAPHYGLADLYQLRGRVGRRRQKGHAYFLYNQTQLTALQRARLAALTEASRLGSGWSLAQRDLEIRGAGNLLGAEQSGSVNAVGVQLYLDMIRRAVDQQANQLVRRHDVDIHLPITAHIPASYLTDIEQRTIQYQQLSRAPTPSDLSQIARQITKQHGQPPPPLVNLYNLLELQHTAAASGITSIESQTIKPPGQSPYYRLTITPLNESQISQLLNMLPGWQSQDDKIIKEIPTITPQLVPQLIKQLSPATENNSHFRTC